MVGSAGSTGSRTGAAKPQEDAIATAPRAVVAGDAVRRAADLQRLRRPRSENVGHTGGPQKNGNSGDIRRPSYAEPRLLPSEIKTRRRKPSEFPRKKLGPLPIAGNKTRFDRENTRFLARRAPRRHTETPHQSNIYRGKERTQPDRMGCWRGYIVPAAFTPATCAWDLSRTSQSRAITGR